MRSFVKWVGGKQRSLKHILPHVPASFRRYHEPFLGGGAVFLGMGEAGLLSNGSLPPFLSDFNHILAATWREVQTHPRETAELLELFRNLDSEQLYLDLRIYLNEHHADDEGRWESGQYAATFIYLNRAGFNGLFRVNKQGELNASFAKTRPTGKNIVQTEAITAASAFLQQTQAVVADQGYLAALDAVKAGDFVYLDPPYDGTYANYTFPPFTQDDQVQLARRVRGMAAAGASFIISNSDTSLIRELYEGFTILETTRTNTVNTNTADRSPKRDLTILSWRP